LVAYAVFGTSRQLVVAATSASAAMLASTVAALGPADQKTYVALATALVLLVGVVFVGAGVVKLGFITQFISRPVMDGFVFGLAIFITVSQLNKIFGVSKGTGDTLQTLWHVLVELGHTNLITLGLSLGALLLLFGLERIAPRLPAGLLVLALGIAVSTLFHLAAHAVDVVGKIPAGLPAVGLPHVGAANAAALLSGAAGIALVVYSEALGAADTFASKHGYEVKANQELIALGVANLGSGLLGGLVAGGGMSGTAVNDGAGARTQVSSLAAAGLALITVVALTPLFTNLPEAVLGALIIHAVSHLMKVRQMRRYFALARSEFWLGLLALVGVITLDVLPGLIIAVVASLILFVYHSSRPHASVLGRVPDVPGAYADVERHHESQTIPGLVIMRLDAPLYFGNASLVRDRLKELAAGGSGPVRAMLYDMTANDELDVTSCEMLEQLIGDLHKAGVSLLLAEVHTPVRDMLARSRVLATLGGERVFPTVEAAVQAFLAAPNHATGPGAAAPGAPREHEDQPTPASST
jgi:high affinity sulfate transporter 1